MEITLSALLGSLPGQGRPRLTWYGSDERVELSGHVLGNWVTKAAHLLVDDLDAGPHRQITIDLPGHWRTVVWALAALRVGVPITAQPTSANDAADEVADIVVSDRPDRWPHATDLAVLALPALARSAGPVPPHGIDANAAVMIQPDQPGAWPQPDPATIALLGPQIRHDELFNWARSSSQNAGGRVLAAGDDPLDILGVVLASLSADGSVVLGDTAWAAQILADPAHMARLVQTERIDHVLLPVDPEAPGTA